MAPGPFLPGPGPWISTRPRQETAAAGGTVHRTSTRNLVWNVQAHKQADRRIVWNVRDRQQSDRRIVWNSRARATSTRRVVWNITGHPTSQRRVVWNVRARPTSNRRVVWNVRRRQQSDRRIVWTDRGHPVSQRRIVWNVGGHVTATRRVVWNVRARQTSTRRVVWNVGALITERAADYAGGNLSEWDQSANVNGTGSSVVASTDHAYTDTFSGKFVASDASASPFARNIWNTDLREGQEVWYGCALYLPTGFYAAQQSQLDFLRWDNFPQDGVNTERTGLSIISGDDKLKLVEIKLNAVPQQSTIIDSGMVLAEGQWHWIEVHQIISATDGQATNELKVNGVSVGTSSNKNARRSDIIYGRLRSGIVALGTQVAPLTIYTDRARISRTEVGPLVNHRTSTRRIVWNVDAPAVVEEPHTGGIPFPVQREIVFRREKTLNLRWDIEEGKLEREQPPEPEPERETLVSEPEPQPPRRMVRVPVRRPLVRQTATLGLSWAVRTRPAPATLTVGWGILRRVEASLTISWGRQRYREPQRLHSTLWLRWDIEEPPEPEPEFDERDDEAALMALLAVR